MKRILLFSFLLIISTFGNAQNTHVLQGNDFYFSPDTLYITAGDTVEFLNNGYHSATEVDSTDWVNNVSNPNGGFYVGIGAPTTDMKFTIDIPGTYYNICDPHAGGGMKSIIIVEASSSGIPDQASEKETILYPNPTADALQVNKATFIRIFDLNGKLLLEKSNLSENEIIDVSTLSPGTYTVESDSGVQKLIKK